MFETLNFVEAGLWGAIGIGFLLAALRPAGRARGRCALSAALFIAFGASDLMETRTGAWWRPWWLLALKSGCIAGLLWLFWAHRSALRAERDRRESNHAARSRRAAPTRRPASDASAAPPPRRRALDHRARRQVS